jgi:hypothetical protein
MFFSPINPVWVGLAIAVLFFVKKKGERGEKEKGEEKGEKAKGKKKKEKGKSKR